jgi:predicted RNA-binding protein with RPS1 domain
MKAIVSKGTVTEIKGSSSFVKLENGKTCFFGFSDLKEYEVKMSEYLESVKREHGESIVSFDTNEKDIKNISNTIKKPRVGDLVEFLVEQPDQHFSRAISVRILK